MCCSAGVLKFLRKIIKTTCEEAQLQAITCIFTKTEPSYKYLFEDSANIFLESLRFDFDLQKTSFSTANIDSCFQIENRQ